MCGIVRQTTTAALFGPEATPPSTRAVLSTLHQPIDHPVLNVFDQNFLCDIDHPPNIRIKDIVRFLFDFQWSAIYKLVEISFGFLLNGSAMCSANVARNIDFFHRCTNRRIVVSIHIIQWQSTFCRILRELSRLHIRNIGGFELDEPGIVAKITLFIIAVLDATKQRL